MWFEAACSAQDALAFEGLAFEHQHLNTATLAWEGKEKEGLVPGRRLRPDGIVQVDGKVTDVFFYHGNLFHGFPPEHEAYDTEVHLPHKSKTTGEYKWVNTKERYEKTVADMQLFKERGFTVHYLWEHHHQQWKRAKGAYPLWELVCVF